METLYAPVPQVDPLQQIINALQAELQGLFQVQNVSTRGRGRVISFGGRLLYEPDSCYNEIQRRFTAHGYTPMLRYEDGQDVVMAMEGVVETAKTGNPLVNLLLLLATIGTTLAAGAELAGQSLGPAMRSGSASEVISVLVAGAPFAIALMLILSVHEFGHYLAAQYHGVKATLPYFIPFPVGIIGTLGAFIAIRSPMKNRRVLFDIGLSGPLAGLMMAVPIMFLGLILSTDYVPTYMRGLTLDSLGSSILVGFIVDLMTDIPPGETLVFHPIFFAAWLGFFLTGINLLPVGQLDGGHAAYALFGRFAHWLAIVVFAGLLVAGFLFSNNWFIWAFFILLGGLRHPPPMNDISDVGLWRKVVGLLTILLFVLIIMPAPFPQ